MPPLQMALWQAGRDGHPAVRGQLICHSGAGSVHLDPIHRTPAAGRLAALDRHRRRRLRQRAMETVPACSGPSASAPPSSTPSPYQTLADVVFATAGRVDWSRPPAAPQQPRHDPAPRV